MDTDSYSKIRLKPGESIAGKSFDTGKSFLNRTREEANRVRGRLRRENARLFELARGGLEVESNICTPIRTSDGQTIGVITIGSTIGAFDHDDLSLLRGVADEVAMAVQNARLYTRLERHAKELEQKNAELERFTYTVSHDLKSPLITIKGFLGHLEKDALAGDIELMKEDINEIVGGADKMHQLLNELLELSRIGRVVSSPRDVSLLDLARDAVDLVSAQIEQASVVVDVAPDLPIVRGDPVRLVEVFQNLLDNAVKFMGDQPRPRIEIGVRREDDTKVYFVRDNGIGIEPRHHQKIFGLFDQLDPRHEGSGIGLALVSRIIEYHGGRAWIESAGTGQGTTICFTIAELSTSDSYPDDFQNQNRRKNMSSRN